MPRRKPFQPRPMPDPRDPERLKLDQEPLPESKAGPGLGAGSLVGHGLGADKLEDHGLGSARDTAREAAERQAQGQYKYVADRALRMYWPNKPRYAEAIRPADRLFIRDDVELVRYRDFSVGRE